jgi:hypothetical protein
VVQMAQAVHQVLTEALELLLRQVLQELLQHQEALALQVQVEQTDSLVQNTL